MLSELRRVASIAKQASKVKEISGDGAAQRLWEKIAARTDELYVVAEKLQPAFENAMRRVAHEAGLLRRLQVVVSSRHSTAEGEDSGAKVQKYVEKCKA